MRVDFYTKHTSADATKQMNAALRMIQQGGTEYSVLDADGASPAAALKETAGLKLDSAAGYTDALMGEALYRDAAYVAETRGYVKTLGLKNLLRGAYDRCFVRAAVLKKD